MAEGKIGNYTYLTNGSETYTENICPSVPIWPRPKLQAALWIVLHVIHCIVTRRWALGLLDFIVIMRRLSWNVHRWGKRQKEYGSYLSVCN